MAFENLFIRRESSLAGVQLDAVISEKHGSPVTFTENEVELGAAINDHARVELKQLELMVRVSDTPLGLAAFGKIIDDVTGLFGSSTTDNSTRSVAAYNALIQIQEQREPITVQTGLKQYESMGILEINIMQDVKTSRVADMVIKLQEVRIVESVFVELKADQLEGATKQQAAAAENKGRVEPVEPEPSANKSVIKSVSDWVTG